MVAALGLFEPEEILVKVFLGRPGGAVDALQLRVPRVAAPMAPATFISLKACPRWPVDGRYGPTQRSAKSPCR